MDQGNSNNNDDDKKQTGSNNLSQLEQDIRAKNQGRSSSTSSGTSTKPGAVAAGGGANANSSSDGLSQLERDIHAKQGAARGTGNKPPGDGLTQLERDVAAKQNSRASAGASRPGAVAAGTGAATAAGNLSQLERDILAKDQGRSAAGSSRPGATPMVGGGASTTAGLLQLEQDIAAKQGARGGRPGAVAAGGGGTMTQLEQDIVTKTQSTMGATSSASRPGVTPVNRVATDQLSQLERDVAAKTLARGGMAVSPVSNHSQLERDVAAKQGARGGAAASRPGAVAAGVGSQLEQDIAAKQQAARGAGLTQLEQDIVAKTQARAPAASMPGAQQGSSFRDIDAKMAARGPAMSRPGAAAAGGGGALTQLEQDIVNKTSGVKPAPSMAATSSLNQLEQDLIAKRAAKPPPQESGLRQLEDSVRAKQVAMGGSGGGGRVQEALSQLERDTMAKALHGAPPSPTRSSRSIIHDPSSPRRQHMSVSAPVGPSIDDIYGNYDRPSMPSPSSSRQYVPGVTPNMMRDQDPEAPIFPTNMGTSVDIAGADAGGIEAFVAENVVDATGVAVIMSDEEEEVEIKKRQRKILTLMGIGVMMLLLVVILPVALLVGGGPKTTEAPTSAPTNSPTASPTTIQVPETIAALVVAGISTLDDLQNSSGPQGRALRWIVMEDESTQGMSPSDAQFIQRYVLAVLYFATNGDNWVSCNRKDPVCDKDAKSWLTNNNECNWYGLTCDEKGRVVTFQFNNEVLPNSYDNVRAVTLKGRIPAEFRYLRSLTVLYIPNMELDGQILDYLTEMTRLQSLRLPGNQFTGTIPQTFGADHPNLLIFDLSDNKFNGPLLEDLSSMQYLQTLSLWTNAFNGKIPTTLGNLVYLEFLDLHDNQLSGAFPSTLYNARNITTLSIGTNFISGSIGSEIGQMTNLQELIIGSSQMNGFIPPEIFSLKSLATLKMNDSNFTGTLSNEGFAKLAPTLQILWLEGNNFQGPIPISAIEQMDLLEELRLEGNALLTGSIPLTVCLKRGTGPSQISMLTVDCKKIPCAADGCCIGCSKS